MAKGVAGLAGLDIIDLLWSYREWVAVKCRKAPSMTCVNAL